MTIARAAKQMCAGVNNLSDYGRGRFVKAAWIESIDIPLKHFEELGSRKASLGNDASQGSAFDVAAVHWNGDFARRIGRMDQPTVASRSSGNREPRTLQRTISRALSEHSRWLMRRA